MKAVIYLPFINIIKNGNFETGSLDPWWSSSTNVRISNLYSHSGSFSALMFGDTTNSVLIQEIPATFFDNFEFSLSIGKIGSLPSPQINIALIYWRLETFPPSFIGMNITIPVGHLPDTLDNNWSTISEITSVVPNAPINYGKLIIHKIPAPGTADIVVDDIVLLQTSTNKPT